MPLCPICGTALATVPQREGVFHFCPTCNGRALTIPQIRRVAGDHFAVKAMRFLRLSTRSGERFCPFCGEHFLSFDFQDPPLALEGCMHCSVIWFGAQQYASVPEWTVNNSNAIVTQATEINGLQGWKELKEREEAEKEEARKKGSLRHSIRELRAQEKR